MAEKDTTTARASSTTSGGGSGWLAFIVGGLVVAIGVLAWVLFGGSGSEPSGGEINISVEGTEGGAEGAGAAVEGGAAADADSDAGGADSGN